MVIISTILFIWSNEGYYFYYYEKSCAVHIATNLLLCYTDALLAQLITYVGMLY